MDHQSNDDINALRHMIKLFVRSVFAEVSRNIRPERRIELEIESATEQKYEKQDENYPRSRMIRPFKAHRRHKTFL